MFVIARTTSKRPSLQHILHPDDPDYTLCGLNISLWSRAYQRSVISAVLCMKCGRLKAGLK